MDSRQKEVEVADGVADVDDEQIKVAEDIDGDNALQVDDGVADVDDEHGDQGADAKVAFQLLQELGDGTQATIPHQRAPFSKPSKTGLTRRGYCVVVDWPRQAYASC